MSPRSIATPALLAALANLGLATYPDPRATCSPIAVFERCHAPDEPSPYNPDPTPAAATFPTAPASVMTPHDSRWFGSSVRTLD